MRSTIRLGKIFGIPVGINASWFLVIVLITFLLESQFGLEFPRWGADQTWPLAGITGLLFFGSVLAHELAHSVVATTLGIPVRGITLFVFGGISNIAHEAHRPWVEFLIAIAGPMLSIALGAILMGVAYITFDWNNAFYIVALTLGWTNLALGVFNLLPGFPLDGGRVLRAIIWSITGNYRMATSIAARFGQGLAVIFVSGSVLWFVVSGEPLRLWVVLIGLFLFTSASTALKEVRQRDRYHGVTAGQVSEDSCIAIEGATLVSELVERKFMEKSQTCFLVTDGGIPGGVLPLQPIRDTPKSLWGALRIEQIMTGLDALPQLETTTPFADLLDYFEDDNPPPAIVLKSGINIVGAVTRIEIERYMNTRQNLGM